MMMILHKEIYLILITLAVVLTQTTTATGAAATNRIKRMYAMCPPEFIRIGNECYFISNERANWLDAHFNCKDRNSRLAEPVKVADRLLRKHLMVTDRNRTDKWIGGTFNWERNKWQWGYNGRDITYQSFSQMMPGRDLKYHCAVFNPELKYRWSARTCSEKHQYVCQHRMPKVSSKNRERVYNRWNATYPNQMANEIEVVINQDEQHRMNPRNYAREWQNNVIRNEHNTNRNYPENRRSPRKNGLLNKIHKRTDGGREILTNDIQQTPMLVEYASDPLIELPNQTVQNSNDTNVKGEKGKRKRKPGRKNRRRKTSTTTTTTTSPIIEIESTTPTSSPPPPPSVIPSDNPIETTTRTTTRITKEEMKRKEEARMRWEKEQIRLQETKRLLDEENVTRKRELEAKRRLEMQRQRELEIFKQEQEQLKQIQNDAQRIEATRMLALEQDKIRQQELRNEQIEERIREDEEKRRQEKIARHEAAAAVAAAATAAAATETAPYAKDVASNLNLAEAKINDPRIEDRRQQQRKIQERLQKLTPQQLLKFYQKRAERNKIRELKNDTNNEINNDGK